MKLASLKIQNFRGIRNLELNFRDSLGRIQDLILIVGPNASGKTSILDAIWFGLQGQIGYRNLRPTFRAEPRYVVTSNERFSKIIYQIVITEQERAVIEQWKQKLIDAGAIGRHPGPRGTEGEITWTYPAQPGYDENPNGQGGYKYENGYDWAVLQGKNYARRLKRLFATPIENVELAGGIYFFEQERQIISNPVQTLPVNGHDTTDDTATPPDIRSMLVDWGVKDKLGQIPLNRNWYRQIQESYNYICSPHKMGEVYAPHSGGEYEIDFEDENGHRYQFDGLSSGERSVLNLMVQYFVKQMRNSIVLIDELELHLHPTWQRRILQNFLQLNDGNQFIITTHSPALREAVPSEGIIELGKLDEPEWQYADTDTEG